MKIILTCPIIANIRDTDEENPGWAAQVTELPGCITQGGIEEPGKMVEDAMRGWIGSAFKGERTNRPSAVHPVKFEQLLAAEKKGKYAAKKIN